VEMIRCVNPPDPFSVSRCAVPNSPTGGFCGGSGNRAVMGTPKNEWVCLRPAQNGSEQRHRLSEFFDWYDRRRPRQSLDWKTPDEAYFAR
ncbi:MAG: integrase core domain-containing protein, partial [Rhodocyclaceae bacterium]